jgi:predicted RecA/RadA family phage recombinase
MAREAFLKVQRSENPTIKYTNASDTDIGAGQVVQVVVDANSSAIAGVTVADIDASCSGIVDVGNVYAFPCGASQSFSAGGTVYWSDASQAAIPVTAATDTTSDFVLGSAYKSTTGSFVWVGLNDGPDAYKIYSDSTV